MELEQAMGGSTVSSAASRRRNGERRGQAPPRPATGRPDRPDAQRCGQAARRVGRRRLRRGPGVRRVAHPRHGRRRRGEPNGRRGAGRHRRRVPSAVDRALYQIWPTQPEFQSELLLHLAADLSSTVYPTPSTTQAHLDEGIRGYALRDLTMREAWLHSRVDPIARAMLAAYPRIANPQIRSHLADGYTNFFEQVAPAWRLILAECGRRPRPGYTEVHVARTVAAAIEGFTLQWLADPGALTDPRVTTGGTSRCERSPRSSTR
ncbi:MAG: hypothetical protein R2697_19065 [Ilumatobacteraceae bacterium]